MIIIGLSGYAGSGKDLFAELASEIVWSARVAFADALRREIAQAFGISPLELLRNKQRPNPRLRPPWCTDPAFTEILIERRRDTYTPREVLQLWGTEYRRAQDPEYWVKRAAEMVDACRFIGYPVCLITDVRFPNEAAWVESAGGQVWRIERPGIEPVNSHCSERLLDDWRFALRIRNDGSIEQLRKIARDLVGAYLPVAL